MSDKTMKQSIKYCILLLLLSTYLVVGVLGHLNVLALLGLGSGQEHVRQDKNPLDRTVRVYWTQHKHIPATVKITVSGPGLLIAPEALPQLTLILCVIEHDSFFMQELRGFSSTSRAPPIS
jgi:hypothetical protein